MSAAHTDLPRSDGPARDLQAPSSSSWPETAEEARTRRTREGIALLLVIALVIASVIWTWFIYIVRLLLGEESSKAGENLGRSWQYWYDSWQWSLLYAIMGVAILFACFGIACLYTQRIRSATIFGGLCALCAVSWFAIFLLG